MILQICIRAVWQNCKNVTIKLGGWVYLHGWLCCDCVMWPISILIIMLSLSVRSSTDWNITPNTFVQDPPGLQSSSSKLSTISPYLHPRVILLTCTWPARASAHCARTHGHQCKCFQCHIPRITSLVPDLPMSVPFCEMMITRQADEIRNNSFYFPLKMNRNYLIPENIKEIDSVNQSMMTCHLKLRLSSIFSRLNCITSWPIFWW